MNLILFSVYTIISFFISSIIYKYASAYFDYHKISAISIGIGAIPMLFALLPNPIALFATLSNYRLDFAIGISSIFLLLGYVLNFKTLKTEQVTNTFALAQIQPAMLIAFGIFVMREQLFFSETVALMFLITGTFLIISNDKLKLNRKFIPTIFANVSWSIYWFIITFLLNANADAVSVIFMARMLSFAFGIVFLLWFDTTKIWQNQKKKLKDSNVFNKKLSMAAALLLIAAALADGAGNVVFAVMDQAKHLVFASIFLSILPALIGIFAYVFFKDKFSRLQILGLVLVVITGVVLSI
ncbi:MAG: DMT family transporter [Candidatus Marsarchaeota archaeon]|nr:DMT family transporter [Candidatus Marsarchaeota archaeon]